jgi:adenylate cyclase
VSTDQVERKLTAIFAADVEGYSRLMGIDEVGTLRTLTAYREIIDGLIAQGRGRIFNTAGDSVLAEFPSVVAAVQCAVEAQRVLGEENAKRSREQRMRFRIGVHVGDVLVQGENLFGDGVNIAARLETLADPGGICVSGSVRDYVGRKLPIVFTDCGEQAVKNIAEPVRAFRIGASAPLFVGANERPSLPLPDKPSIAVLPFTSLSGDPEQEFFADGIVEDIITALSRFRWLFVIARNSSFTYKGRAVDVKQISRELGVRYVLEGSVRRAANRVRVTAQLVDAETAAHVWADRYDRPLEDIFAMQDEITDTIVATIEPEMSASERDRARRKPPEHIGAWELYQRGMWHFYRRNREDLSAAETYFRDAIRVDQGFAAPRAAFAASCFFHILHGISVDPAAMLAKMFDEASKAVSLDPRDALAHSALGMAFMESGDFAKAISEHRTAISLNPNSSFARWCFAYTLEASSHFEEALEHSGAAIRLSPRDPGIFSYLTLKASILYQLRRYEEAISFASDATHFQVVDLTWPYLHLAAAYGQLNRQNEAVATIKELRRRRPALTISAFLTWPHIKNSQGKLLAHMVDGLRKAGLPEE